MNDDLCFRCNQPADSVHTVRTEGARVVVPLCSPCDVGGGPIEIAVQISFPDGTICAHGPSLDDDRAAHPHAPALALTPAFPDAPQRASARRSLPN